MAKVGEPGGARAMETWLLPFAALFTRPSWLNAVALAQLGHRLPKSRSGTAACEAAPGS